MENKNYWIHLFYIVVIVGLVGVFTLSQAPKNNSQPIVQTPVTISGTINQTPVVTEKVSPDCDPSSSNEYIKHCQPLSLISKATEAMDIELCSALKDPINREQCNNAVSFKLADRKNDPDQCKFVIASHTGKEFKDVQSQEDVQKQCIYAYMHIRYYEATVDTPWITPEKFCQKVKDDKLRKFCVASGKSFPDMPKTW